MELNGAHTIMHPARIGTASVAVAVFIAAILLANWATTTYHFVPVGFGLESTAGVFFAGFALASRDAIQDAAGRWAVVAVILVGTVLSFAISAPFIAVASAAAFLLAELFDFGIYTPLRKRSAVGDRRWAVAVLASNVGGAVMDTVVFIGIAFGAAAVMPAMAGQLVGKGWATLAYLVVGTLVARVWAARTSRPLAPVPA